MILNLFLAAGLLVATQDVEKSLAVLRAVGPEGEGNVRATAAWRDVVSGGPEALLPTLAAFDGAGPRASNWLRTAVDAIAERHLAGGGSLDAQALEAFIRDTSHSGAARYLAYEWLSRIDPKAPDRLLPGMLDDPGRELRRDAVARALAGVDDTAEALTALLGHARETSQVDAIAKRLKKLGVEADLKAHYGVIDRWVLITSFDNTGMKGFDVAYAPEKEVRLDGGLKGKGGEPVRFIEHTTSDPRGKVDLNKVIGKEKDAIAYAYAVVDSPDARPVELRFGCPTAMKVYLNGQLLYFRNEYHHGVRPDQYTGHGELKKGRNEILIKVCQNNQKQDWAQKWEFQARLADRLGGGIPLKNVTPSPGGGR